MKPKVEAWAVVGSKGVASVRLTRRNAENFLLPELGERIAHLVEADAELKTLRRIGRAAVNWYLHGDDSETKLWRSIEAYLESQKKRKT